MSTRQRLAVLIRFMLFTLSICLIFTFCSCDESTNDSSGSGNTDFPSSYEPDNPLQKGDRLYGINISENKEGFSSSAKIALEAGIDLVELNINWNSIESSQGVYTDPGGNLAATALYAANDVKVCFSIAVINTVTWEVPSYLDNTDPDSAQFISAFNNMIDWFMANVPSTVTIPSISIGNEVDLVLSGSDDWQKYEDFYKAASQHIKDNYPEVKVGVKTTVMGGLFKDEKDEIISINQYSDVIMLNYYSQNDSFEVKPPSDVHDDFKEIVACFPNNEIWFTEIGYQSGSTYCKSSEEKQAKFYHEMFTAWDTYRENIKFVLINWLHDQSPETIESWKDYYGDSEGLVEYLSTLGLRNYDNTDKLAFPQVKKEAFARGWSEKQYIE